MIGAQGGADSAAGAWWLAQGCGDGAVGRAVAGFHGESRLENSTVKFRNGGEVVAQIGEVLQVAPKVTLHARYNDGNPQRRLGALLARR